MRSTARTMGLKHLLKPFRQWQATTRDTKEEQKAALAAMDHVVQLRAVALYRACRHLRDTTRGTTERKRLMGDALRRMATRQVSMAFEQWQSGAGQMREEMRKLKQAVMKMAARKVSAGFGAWRETAAAKSVRHELARCFTYRTRSRLLTWVLHSLVVLSTECQHATGALQVVRRHEFAKAVHTWQGTAASCRRSEYASNLVQAALVRLTCRLTSMAWEIWQAVVQDAASQQHLLHQATAHMFHKLRAQTYAAWRVSAREASAQELALTSAARQPTSRCFRAAWSTWLHEAQCSLNLRKGVHCAAARVASMLSCLVANAWCTWRASSEETRARNVLGCRAAVQFLSWSLRTAWQSWQGFGAHSTLEQHSLRVVEGYVRRVCEGWALGAWRHAVQSAKSVQAWVLGMALWGLRRAWIVWLEQVRAVVAEQQQMHSACRWRTTRLVQGWMRKGWAEWRQGTRDQHREAAVVHRALRKMSSRLLAWVYGGWVAEARVASLQYTRAAAAVKEILLGQVRRLWVSWREAAMQHRQSMWQAGVVASSVVCRRSYMVGAAWGMWYEAAGMARDDKAVGRRVLVQMRHHGVTRVWRRWCEATKASAKHVWAGQLAEREGLCRLQANTLVKWLTIATSQVNQAKILHACITRMKCRLVWGCFQTWYQGARARAAARGGGGMSRGGGESGRAHIVEALVEKAAKLNPHLSPNPNLDQIPNLTRTPVLSQTRP